MKRAIFFFHLFLYSTAFCGWNPTFTTITSNTSDFYYNAPYLALNHSGYTVSVWSYFDNTLGTTSTQAAISNDFGGAWSLPTIIDPLFPTSGTININRPRVVVDSANRAIIIWQRHTGGLHEVKVTPYGATPQMITTLDNNTGVEVPRPEIAMDESGHAVAVWGNGTTPNVYVMSRRSSDYGTNWLPVINIDSPNPSADKNFPHVAMDQSGNVIAVWTIFTGGFHYTKVATSSDYGASWNPAITLDPANPSATFTHPRVVMDDNGHALIIWFFADGAGDNFTRVASSSDYGGNWGNLVTLNTVAGQEETYPKIDMDSSGHAVAVWVNPVSGTSYAIQTAHSSDFGVSWSPPFTIDPALTTEFTYPEVSIDNFGHAIIVWNVHDTLLSSWEIKRSNSFDYGSTWINGLLDSGVETDGNHEIPRPRIFMDKTSSKNAVRGLAIWPDVKTAITSAWIKMNQFYEIFQIASGVKEKAKGFLQIDLRNNITIEATGEPGTFSLYKDPGLTQLVDSVTNDGRETNLFEHHVKQGETYTYYVTFTDVFNQLFGPKLVVVSD